MPSPDMPSPNTPVRDYHKERKRRAAYTLITLGIPSLLVLVLLSPYDRHLLGLLCMGFSIGIFSMVILIGIIKCPHPEHSNYWNVSESLTILSIIGLCPLVLAYFLVRGMEIVKRDLLGIAMGMIWSQVLYLSGFAVAEACWEKAYEWGWDVTEDMRWRREMTGKVKEMMDAWK